MATPRCAADHSAILSPIDAPSTELDFLAALAAESICTHKSSISINLLTPPKNVADDIRKYLICNSENASRWVLRMSPSAFPQRVANTQRQALRAADLLDNELNSAVVVPHTIGAAYDGRTYAIVPYCIPIEGSGISSFVFRKIMFPRLINWLRLLTQRTARVATGEELKKRFVAPLESMLQLDWIPSDLAKLGEIALQKIRQGTWCPLVVFSHGDLWSGNVLRRCRKVRQQSDSRFGSLAIIDWDGFLEDGYAFVDLIRFGPCLGKSWISLKREVVAHAVILGCRSEDIELYFAAAHAAIAIELQNFPKEQFSAMHHTILETLRASIV